MKTQATIQTLVSGRDTITLDEVIRATDPRPEIIGEALTALAAEGFGLTVQTHKLSPILMRVGAKAPAQGTANTWTKVGAFLGGAVAAGWVVTKTTPPDDVGRALLERAATILGESSTRSMGYRLSQEIWGYLGKVNAKKMKSG